MSLHRTYDGVGVVCHRKRVVSVAFDLIVDLFRKELVIGDIKVPKLSVYPHLISMT